MLPSLYSSRRFAASLALAALVFSIWNTTLPGWAAALPTASMPQDSVASQGSVLETATPNESVLLAHHEGSVVGANQLLTAKVSATGNPVIHGLWANMIMNMAIQNDPEIQRIAKKLGGMNSYVLASVGMISSLSLAQSIDGIATLQQDPHPLHPPIIGLVGAGLSVLSVGTEAAVEHHYKKALKIRQEALTQKVVQVMGDLKSKGGTDEDVQKELASLMGSEASEEFIGLWQAAHPAPALKTLKTQQESQKPEASADSAAGK